MIRASQNGTASEVIFHRRKIYHDWDQGDTHKSDLGMKLCTVKWIENRVTDKSKLDDVLDLFIDWELYENGWYVPYGDGYKNKHLLYYLTQMGSYSTNRPKALDYLSKD